MSWLLRAVSLPQAVQRNEVLQARHLPDNGFALARNEPSMRFKSPPPVFGDSDAKGAGLSPTCTQNLAGKSLHQAGPAHGNPSGGRLYGPGDFIKKIRVDGTSEGLQYVTLCDQGTEHREWNERHRKSDHEKQPGSGHPKSLGPRW